ncbi:retrovirus-related pol polyprotein from transposon TNT 1-94 [Tanacetum coccineum]
MSSMSEDIQCAGSDTRPPMLDRTYYKLLNLADTYTLNVSRKDNGENIMKSINEGPFHMGTVSDVIAGGTEGAVQQGPVHARVLNDLSAEKRKGGQNRGGIINPGQAKPIKCYNCNGLGHIARECPRPKRLQDSDYFKDKMLLMRAQEMVQYRTKRKMKKQSLFLAGEQVTNFDEDVDNSPENDLALNVDHVFEADECDAFDSDVDEGPTTQTMFMVNLTSEDPIYDEVGPSYDSNTPFEVQDHDTFVNHMDEYHEVHEMQSDVQHNYVVDSDADYTSDSNIIPYGVQSRLANKPNMVVKDSVTSELARYKELVGEYEKRAKFELTDRERKIDEQMRIIISDRNRKETSLKSELHSAQILLSSTVGHYKSKTEEVTILKKDFKQKEDKFLEEFLDIKRLKERKWVER